jgi:hypothetical protein
MGRRIDWCVGHFFGGMGSGRPRALATLAVERWMRVLRKPNDF